MSNKTQILCNKNNRRILQIVEELKKDIKDNSIQLLKSKVEENEITNDISRLIRKNLNTNLLLVRLGRLHYFIKNLEDYNNGKKDYIKYCLTKLIIY